MRKTSKKYSLDWMDAAKALLLAALSSVLFIAQQALDKGEFPTWKNIGMAAVSGAVAYLIKNFFTPAKVVQNDVAK